MTRDWWDMLSLHPLVDEFIETDWSYLLVTARIHAEFWRGKMALAAELRLREAKYGFTPEDRLRLRISLAQTVEAEGKVGSKKPSSSRDRFAGMEIAAEASGE
ncbi:hypothetical protein E3T43_07175 [Cryobacterium sp. Hh7]|nr:hypothetical protein E3T43_07175 [Cryobacterium sp. Hh7]